MPIDRGRACARASARNAWTSGAGHAGGGSRARPPSRRSAAVAASFLLAACAAPEPPAIEADAGAHALLERRLDDPQLQRFVDRALGSTAVEPVAGAGRADAPAWNLARLTLAAVYFHPDLQLARSQLALAQAHAQSARARPSPSWSAVLGRGAGASVASPWVVGAAVEFLLDAGGHRRWQIAQAERLEAAARADLRQAGWQVRGRIAAGLIDRWSAQRRIEALDRQVDLQSQRVAAIGRRVEAGESPRAEQRRELAQRDVYASALAQAKAEQARARADLAQAVGIPAEALDAARIAGDAFDRVDALDEAAVGGALRSGALQGRADVAVALARVDAAQADLRAEVAKRWPDLRVGPGYQFDLGANKYTLSAAVDWPRTSDGPMREALARREVAAAELLEVQAAAIARIDRALSEWRLAAEAEPPLRAAAERAGLAERAARAQFDAGSLDRPALLAAGIDRIEAQAVLDTAQARQFRALAALEDALQRPLAPDAPDVLAPANLAVAGAP